MQTTPSIWKPPLGKLTLGLTLVVVATGFEALAVATILPKVTAELEGLAWYGWTFSAFMLANLVGITLGGDATDRRGAALPFLAGTGLFMAGLVLSGLAPSMAVLVAGRTAQGLGAGLLSAVAYAAIARAYAVESQPRVLATLSSAWVVPGLVGPGVASLIAEQVSWRWVFLGLSPLSLLAALLVLPSLRQMKGDLTVAKDSARTWLALELAVGASAALIGVGLHSWFGAPLLTAAGVAASVHALGHLMPAGTLRARAGLPSAVATLALVSFAFFGTEAFLPLAVTDVRGASVTLSGLALTAAAVCWTAGSWLPVRLARRLARPRIIVGGLSVLALAIVMTLSLLAPSVPVTLAVLAWAVAGLGMGVAFTSVSAAILEGAEQGSEGAASASLQLAQVLGAALGTGLAGAAVAAPFAGDPPVLGIATVDVLMLGAVMLALLTARRVAAAAPA